MLQLCALCHILSVYIGIRNVIQTDFGFYFATLGSFGAYLTWHLMVMLTLNSCHDLARVWRNKDVIPMVMLPFPPSYYHCHYNIEFFSPNWIRHSWLHLIRALMLMLWNSELFKGNPGSYMLSDLYRISKHDKASFHNGRSITAAAISLQVTFCLLGWTTVKLGSNFCRLIIKGNSLSIIWCLSFSLNSWLTIFCHRLANSVLVFKIYYCSKSLICVTEETDRLRINTVENRVMVVE